MNIAETDLDGYRIFAAALTPEDKNGYVAAVVVSEIRNHKLGLREVYRDEQLGCGYRWSDLADALSHAIGKGAEAVRRKQYRMGQGVAASSRLSRSRPG